MSGDEILEHGQTFTEVRGDRPLDDFAGGLGHQTAHAGELFDLLAVTTRAGIDHQEDRVQFLASLVMLEGAEHDVGDFVARVSPDIDDLVVALAIGDDAFAILLLDVLDLLVGVRELQLFLLRNDHVGDPDRDAGLGRFAEPEFLQLVERLDGAVLAGDLIAAPDNVAELLLASGFVEEAETIGPDLVEDDATRGRFDDVGFLVAVNRVLAEIRILNRMRSWVLTAPSAIANSTSVALSKSGKRISAATPAARRGFWVR